MELDEYEYSSELCIYTFALENSEFLTHTHRTRGIVLAHLPHTRTHTLKNDFKTRVSARPDSDTARHYDTI